jgi:hypothetical protein
MTDYEIDMADTAALEAHVEALESLCKRALLALHEDYFPELRQDLRNILGITEDN